MEDEDNYRCFSRKELQDLCKKNGLPARKTNSYMAKSLAAYYQKKNVEISTPERSSEAREGWCCTSPVSDMKSQTQFDSIGNLYKDVHGIRVEAVGVNSWGPSSSSKEVSASAVKVVLRESSVYGAVEGLELSNDGMDGITDYLGSKCDVNTYKIKQKDSSNVIWERNFDQDLPCPTRNSGSNKEVVPIPFQFYVRLEEGVNLCVDLNSSLSDWINEVSVHPEMLSKKPWELNHDVRSLGNGSEQLKTSLLKMPAVGFQRKSDTGGIGRVGVNQSDGGDISLECSRVIQARTDTELLGIVKGNREMVLSLCKSNPEVQKLTNLNTSSPQNDETLNLDLEVSNTSEMILVGEHIMDSKSDRLKCVNSPAHQLKSSGVCSENPYKVSVGTSIVPPELGHGLSGGILVNPAVNNDILGNGSVPCSGFLTCGGSMEAKESEVGTFCDDGLNSPCQNGGRPDLYDLMHDFQSENGANNKIDMNTSIKPLSVCPEEQQRSNLRNGTQSPECLQIDKLSKISRSSHGSEPDGLHSKRRHIHSEDKNKPAVKNLKSGKNRARGVSPRRSMRLVSKILKGEKSSN